MGRILGSLTHWPSTLGGLLAGSGFLNIYTQVFGCTTDLRDKSAWVPALVAAILGAVYHPTPK